MGIVMAGKGVLLASWGTQGLCPAPYSTQDSPGQLSEGSGRSRPGRHRTCAWRPGPDIYRFHSGPEQRGQRECSHPWLMCGCTGSPGAMGRDGHTPPCSEVQGVARVAPGVYLVSCVLASPEHEEQEQSLEPAVVTLQEVCPGVQVTQAWGLPAFGRGVTLTGLPLREGWLLILSQSEGWTQAPVGGLRSRCHALAFSPHHGKGVWGCRPLPRAGSPVPRRTS